MVTTLRLWRQVTARRWLLPIVVLVGVCCAARPAESGDRLFRHLGSSSERRFWLGSSVQDIAAGPGDGWLVSAGADGKLHFWDVASGKKTRSISAHNEIALCVDVTEDGKTIVSGGGYGWLCIWDAESGALVHKLGGVGPQRQEALRLLKSRLDDTAIRCLSLAPGGKRVAVGRKSGAVELWDVQTGKLLQQEYAGHGGDIASVHAVSWGPTGRWFATAGADEYVRVWDAASGELIHEMKGPAHRSGDPDFVDSVRAIDVSPDGKRILSGGKGNGVQIWDVETGTLTGAFPAHSANVLAAAFAADGRRAISGSLDGDWCVWDPRTGQCIQPEPAPGPGRSPITAIVAGRSGRWFATGSMDGSIRFWDAWTGEELGKPTGHAFEVTCLVADPKGSWIASGSRDTTVRLWDARSGAAMRFRLGHDEGINALAVTPDGKRLIAGSSDGQVTVWGLTNGEVERTWRAHERFLAGLATTRDRRLLISGGTDTGSVSAWDLASGELTQTLQDFGGWVTHVFNDPSDQHLVAVGEQVRRRGPEEDVHCWIRVWDAKTGERRRTIAEIDDAVVAAALSSDGLVLATAGVDVDPGWTNFITQETINWGWGNLCKGMSNNFFGKKK